MSGFDFDFDALRDHLAPDPGAREREAVRARAGQLRAQSRRNRLALSSVSVVAVAALVLGIVAAQRNNRPEITVEGGPTSSTTAPTTTIPPNAAATTTTTPPASPPSPASSATWVSPDHGWVLRQNGDVAETTDGGATWATVGHVGPSARDGRLRFANATRGYAFDRNDVFATTDGGRSWHLLGVPFHGAADLAIWNGTVYAASYDTTNASVDVWTTPVDASTWTKHPTGIPIGAGPIPYTQLVLSGTKGWLLQVDRDIVGGAQLTPNGDWHTWLPPCAGRNGPALLAASSSSDLVAGCSEHDYGGGPIQSSVWFSHDGGVSFERRLAPGAFVMSPSANAAVVAGLGELEQSTDGGATWRGVAHVASAANDRAVDGGFTTATQGFVIFGDGTMLMTHDAGATWQKVTLP